MQPITFTNDKRKLSSLLPASWNPRQLTEKQANDLKKSLQKFDLAEVPVINLDGVIIAGHQRIKIMRQLFGDIEIDIRIPSRKLTNKEVQEYNIRSNKNTGSWDFDLLANNFELEDLFEWGFTDEELKLDLEPDLIEGETDENDVPEPLHDPITVLGDLWILGSHHLLCGDSTLIDNVDKLLDGKKPHLMVTDPPYGVEYKPEWRKEKGVSKGKFALGKVENDDRADWREAWILFPGEVVYIWHSYKHSHIVIESLLVCDFNLRSQIIWAKQHFVFSRGDYHSQHEACIYAVKKNGTGHWNGDRKQTTLWEINNNNPFGSGSEKEEKVGHGTQKPVECMARPILNNSKEKDAVYDPFLGSGTTIIACEKTNRVCYGLEISPHYCDVIVQRWQNFTGKEAVHKDSGKTFNKLLEIRNK